MIVGRTFVARCGQSVNSSASTARDASPSPTIWWSTSAPTKVPRWRSPVKSAANTSSGRTIYANTGNIINFLPLHPCPTTHNFCSFIWPRDTRKFWQFSHVLPLPQDSTSPALHGENPPSVFCESVMMFAWLALGDLLTLIWFIIYKVTFRHKTLIS